MTEQVSRRSVLKWSAALAAVGIVGVGLGVGGELLLRPSKTTTKTTTLMSVGTTTQTATQTTTQLATTTVQQSQSLSYVPPLSPQVQTRVNAVVSSLIARHAGETVVSNYNHSVGMGTPSGLINVRVNNGAIVCAEPADNIVSQNIPREDSVISQQDLLMGRVQSRGALQNYVSNKFVNAPDRVLYPMIRTSARGEPNGTFVRTSWDNALQMVATNIQNTIAKYGPNSIFPSNTILPYLKAGVTGWGNVSYGAEDFAAEYIMGLSSGSSGEQAPSIFSSKLIVLWGQDPTHTPREAVYYFKLAREQGIPIITIDVKQTIKDIVLSDQFIPIKPGTDAAMMVAVAYTLFNENLYNTAFVNANVEPTGFAKFQAYVMGTAPGPDGQSIPRTPAWAAPICGVPAATIQAFAELYAKSSPTFLFFGPGAARKYHGEDPARLAVYLQIMMGNLGVLGGSATFDGIVPFGTPFLRPTSPAANYGILAATYTLPTLLISYRYPDAINLYSQLQAGTITTAQYQSAIGNPATNPVPNIQMLIWTGDNKINQIQNIQAQMQAIKNVGSVVALIQHMNITAQTADILLPICEHYEYTEGFTSLNSGPIVYVQQLVQPQGESVNPSWIYAELANRLGVLSSYWPTYQTGVDFETQVYNANQTGWNTWSTTAAAKQVYPNGVPTWTEFLQNPIMRIDNPVPATVPWAAEFAGTTKWNTPSGKLEFYSTYLATTNLTATQYGAPIFPMGAYEDIENGYDSPTLAQYPYIQLETHNRHRTHSFQDSNPWIKNEVYRHALWVSVYDAGQLGVTDNELVLITSSAGQTVAPVYVSQRIIPGQVYLHDGAWANFNSAGLDIGGCPNSISAGDLNPDGEDPHIQTVQITKYAGTIGTNVYSVASTTGGN